MRYVKVVPDPTRPADYINTDMITEISVSYDDYRQMLLCISIHTINGSYEHYVGRGMSVNDANNIVERLIYRILDARDMGNIINIDNYID